MVKNQGEHPSIQAELFLALGMQPPVDNSCQNDQELHTGDLCPKCGQARLAYDGLLNLSCPNCGFALGGSFT